MSSVGWCRLVSSFLLGGVAVIPSPVWRCCLPSPPLGGAAFSPVFCWVVLLGFHPSMGGVAVFSLSCLVLLGLLLLLGWWGCFVPRLQLGGVASFAFSGWGGVPLLFSWVVLLGFLLPFGWCCSLSFPFGGVVFLLLFWVELLFKEVSLLFLSLLVENTKQDHVVSPGPQKHNKRRPIVEPSETAQEADFARKDPHEKSQHM